MRINTQKEVREMGGKSKECETVLLRVIGQPTKISINGKNLIKFKLSDIDKESDPNNSSQ